MEGHSEGLELENLHRILAKELRPNLVFERNLWEFFKDAVVTEPGGEVAGVHDLVGATAVGGG